MDEKPFGRSLADFGGLMAAERQLLEGCRRGESTIIGDKLPKRASKPKTIRSSFLRFLALGGDANAPVHEHGIVIRGAWIEGALDLAMAELLHPTTLQLCRIQRIDATNARTKLLSLTGCLLEEGFNGLGIRCTGGLYFADGFRSNGEIYLVGAVVEGNVNMTGAKLVSKDNALSMDGASINGALFIRRGFSATGVIRLMSTVLRAGFECVDAELVGSENVAIRGDGLRVGGITMFMRSKIKGEVRLFGAKTEGNLDLTSLSIDNESGIALTCDGAHIGGDVVGIKLASKGEVRFIGATIDGDVDCAEAAVEGINSPALSLDRATIKGGVFLNPHFSALGQVSFSGCSVAGDFNVSGGAISAKGDALRLDKADVGGNVFLDDGFVSRGSVSAIGAQIDGVLDLRGSTLIHERGCAFAGNHATVKGGLMFMGVREIKGAVDLSSMNVSGLYDDIVSWKLAKNKIVLDGFVYDRIGSSMVGASARIEWLDFQLPSHTKGEFRPQPWEQVIAVLRRMGHPNEARAVAIAKQDRLRREKKILRGTRLLHWAYGLLVGYGYRPLRLVVATSLIWLGFAFAYWTASNPSIIGAQTFLIQPRCIERMRHSVNDICRIDPPDNRNFVPLAYSADVLLPVVSLGYKAEWQIVTKEREGRPLFLGQCLQIGYWLEEIFGWIAGLLLVGVVGSLIKRE